MANRYQTLSYTTASITAGGTSSASDTNRTGLPDYFNILKVKVVPDSLGGSYDIKIFKKDTLLAADLVDFWDNVTTNLYDPQDDSSGSPAEALEGPPLPYDDADATGELHLQITNNDGTAHTYTVTVVYEEVPVMTAAGGATFRSFIRTGDGSASAPAWSFGSQTTRGIGRVGDFVGFTDGTNFRSGYNAGTNNFALSSSSGLAWTSTSNGYDTADLILKRSGAGVLQQSNGTNPQEFRTYGTETGPKLTKLGHDGTNGYLGTFADDPLIFTVGNTGRWTINTSSGSYALYPNADNSYDLAGTSQRIRTGYFGTAVAIGTNPATTGAVRLANTGYIYGRNALNSADVLMYGINASNDVVIEGVATGRVAVNTAAADVDFVVQSDTNANHFVSDAGLQSGGGAFGFGNVAEANSFVRLRPGAQTAPSNESFRHFSILPSAAVAVTGSTTSPIIASAWIAEPNITATGTVSDAYTLYIADAPTEGTRNGALWVASGTSRFDDSVTIAATKNLYFDGGGDTYIQESSANVLRFTAAGTTAVDITATYLALSFGGTAASDGVIRIANNKDIMARNLANSNNIGLIGTDTSDNIAIGTQNGIAAASIILNYLQGDTDVKIRSDNNANHFVSDAGAFSGVGAFGFGAAASTEAFFFINPPAYTSSGTTAFRQYIAASNAITTPASTTVTRAATVYLSEPNLTVGASGAINDAYTLIIGAAPTEGTRNGALWVESGTSRFDGDVLITDCLLASDTSGPIGIGDAALGLRNGTTSYNFHVYNTYTSATSYERLVFGWNVTNSAVIATDKGSAGGSYRTLTISTDGGSNGWFLNASSTPNWTPVTDNAQDIGSTSQRVKTGYLGTSIFVSATSNAKMTNGITIAQGTSDDEIFCLKSSDVAHGITTIAETDTFCDFIKSDGNSGGVQMRGFTEATRALVLVGAGVTDDTAKSTAATSYVEVVAATKSGTTLTDPGANANIFAVRTVGGTTRFILDADGDSHQDVGTAWTNFDTHDDVALLNALAANVTRKDDPLRENFRQWIGSHQRDLEDTKLVSFNPDGHHFINMSRLAMLHTGAIRQIGEKMTQLSEKCTRYENALVGLGVDVKQLQ